MHPLKASVLNGILALFYQQFWPLIGDEVTSIMMNILNDGADINNLNHTYICLIPKVKKPKHAKEFRPISLYNVLFKIITKTIASRLK